MTEQAVPDAGERDEDRWVERRAQFLKREYGLRRPIVEAAAWHELGYSSHGVADRVAVTEGTVRAYFEQIAEEFGEPALLVKLPGQLGVTAPLVPGGEQRDG